MKFNKTELAYQGLMKKCEELQEENKGLKETLDIVKDGMNLISMQNQSLKEKYRRAESTNETLETVNKDLKEKLELKETKQNINIVSHSFSKESNNNRSVNKKNNLVITRQVNN
jgi:predicted nuclease with TOPRIM domain